jgi:hypothetical protein
MFSKSCAASYSIFMRLFLFRYAASGALGQGGCDSLSLFGLKVSAVEAKKEPAFEFRRVRTGMFM